MLGGLTVSRRSIGGPTETLGLSNSPMTASIHVPDLIFSMSARSKSLSKSCPSHHQFTDPGQVDLWASGDEGNGRNDMLCSHAGWWDGGMNLA